MKMETTRKFSVAQPLHNSSKLLGAATFFTYPRTPINFLPDQYPKRPLPPGKQRVLPAYSSYTAQRGALFVNF